ncbi:MAG: hypothetical protein ABW110_01815 [Steroidobacteraceae bacterium]
MFNALRLISWSSDSTQAERERAIQQLSAADAALPMIQRMLLSPTLQPVSRNGGDLIWHLRFGSHRDYRACVRDPVWQDRVQPLLQSPLVSQIEGGTYEAKRRGVRARELRDGIYRAVLVTVEPDTAPELVARYEAQMATMPDYCTGIRNWGMSSLDECFGKRRLTHLWEQEFQDMAAFAPFKGEYFSHPVHAAYIDLWYDPESPYRIIDYRYACSALCKFATSFLSD